MNTTTNLLKLIDFQIISTLFMVIAACKFGDWRNWRLYYPTILYFIVGNLLYSLLTYNYPLWQYESPLLKTTFSNILLTFVFSPALILIYLYHFPKGVAKGIIYIVVWVGISIAIEEIAYLLGFISFHNGWNIWWSILFNFFMLPLLFLHQKRPYLVWVSSFIIAIAVIIYFKIPLNSIK